MSPAHKLIARCTNAYMYMYMYLVVLPCFDEEAVSHCYKCFNAKGCASALENKKIVLHNKACGFTNFDLQYKIMSSNSFFKRVFALARLLVKSLAFHLSLLSG